MLEGMEAEVKVEAHTHWISTEGQLCVILTAVATQPHSWFRLSAVLGQEG